LPALKIDEIEAEVDLVLFDLDGTCFQEHGQVLVEGAPRTDRWFPAIREIAGNVNLRTEKEVARTARLVREGTPVKEAIHKAKMEPHRTGSLGGG